MRETPVRDHPRPGARRGTASAKPPVLIVLHQDTSTPGRVGRLLLERGHPLDIRRPRYGDPLPDTLRDHAGAAVFGGPMSANDPEEFIRREIDWVGVALREDKPFLGKHRDRGTRSRGTADAGMRPSPDDRRAHSWRS